MSLKDVGATGQSASGVGLHWLGFDSIAHVKGSGIRWHGAGVQYTALGLGRKGGLRQYWPRSPLA
eukprot:4129661-Pleurochrysis_carterae.AAC.2